ncbi:efflux RND transporter periplasmic adaptor subunit [Inhella crocodyli]|uniref:HlyD family efflux transporter periplasmic adaptor subunit n=1 Tax=Inhella crocodyli TaxID=2499851 RepID=A0A437LDV9_9BURK|nr:HlyD family efflux transporter periplasmic adaptor subunit [Inhella crocodyli]RVT83606.1 HlyD family efflux transporter periplasmic adaptor subunit [Inhella crocodyli]
MKRVTMAAQATLFALFALLAAGPALAHGDEDHGDAPAAVNSNGPQRQPDGTVFLPKSAQRLMGLRTLPVQQAALPKATELQGVVVMDPNAGGPVQATQAGRLVAPPQGFPALGQRVQRGQVLAYVEPVAGALERSAQAAQVAELQAAQALAEKRLARLQVLADTVPRREIEAAESELQSLRARGAALRQGLGGREALVAPVSGVVAASQALAGQVVDARDPVFEVVDPQRLRIEALAYDLGVAQDVGDAFLVNASGAPQALRFLGASTRLREQALPMQFGGVQGLALGQPVRVVLQTRSTVTGHAVPAQALMKNAANQTIVWVKQAPERFVPKVVLTQPLDGARVAVTQGLSDGDRVVVQGATLLNQVR